MGSAQSTEKLTSELSSLSDENKNWIPIAEAASDALDEEELDDEEEDEDVEERLLILRESRKLKLMAKFFLHPELPVVTSDATATARCFFDRASAPVQETVDESAERSHIINELNQLKKAAKDYLHPELPLETSDATATARCFFDRASAPVKETSEEDSEMMLIMDDMRHLKKAAMDYLHPEMPVVTSDPTLFGRNYFLRPSSSVQLSPGEERERQLILKDARELVKLAREDHTMVALETDPAMFGRNYFDRPSAPMQLSIEEDYERQQILEDTRMLKKLAIDFRHPELPVAVTDPTVFGRNYFGRASAPEQVSLEQDVESTRILTEAMELKKVAKDYLHPELPVTTNDPPVFGRNYFSRPSASQQLSREEAEETQRILEDAKALGRLALDYRHPELPVVASDPTAFGRNYFGRASAAPQTNQDDDVEEELVNIEANRLKNGEGVRDRPRDPAGVELEQDRHWHHAHFDMDDHIHLHHVDFDKNTAHHEEISELKISSPTATRKVIQQPDLPSSPECVMTFAQPKATQNLPLLF